MLSITKNVPPFLASNMSYYCLGYKITQNVFQGGAACQSEVVIAISLRYLYIVSHVKSTLCLHVTPELYTDTVKLHLGWPGMKE